jgi:outer membrane protein assembly factor BamD (BamD/ComL family)
MSVTTDCDCQFVKQYPQHRSDDIAHYLRCLAERVERGEVRHISLSVHPVTSSPSSPRP